MKESRLIIIVLFVLFVLLGPSFYLLNLLYPDLIDYMNVATNLYCGIIVGLITSICQFCSSKRKIINSIYGAYFDVYRLEDTDEFYAIGGEEYFENGISIIEWGELIEDILPKGYIKITFKKNEDDPDYRELQIERMI